MLLLAELQAELAALGVRSVLARNRRLVLKYNAGTCKPSGLTNPMLHALTPDGTGIATTDGTTCQLDSGQAYPASDPTAAAAAMRTLDLPAPRARQGRTSERS